MAKKAAAKTPAKSTKKVDAGVPFEKALDRLEELVEVMEGEQLPLEELISNYEEGNELLQHCQALIDSARQRIEVVQINSVSETENKLATESPKGDTQPSEAAPSDDIRLF